MSIITEALKKADNRRKPVSIVDEAIKKAVSPRVQTKETTIPPKDTTDRSAKPVVKPETMFRPFHVPAVMQGKPTARPIIKPKVKLTVPKRSKSWISDTIWLLIPVVMLVAALVIVGVWKPGLELPVLKKEITRSSSSTTARKTAGREYTASGEKPQTALTMGIEPTALDKQFALSGISNFGGSRSAIVNDKVVETGDNVDGAIVLSITAKKVYLQSRAKVFTLTLS